MASSQTWSEFNTGSFTETATRTECNWKAVDDSTTAYSSSPITAGANSFWKIQAIKFGGTWNSLSTFTYKVSTVTPGTGLSVVGMVPAANTGMTPAATTLANAPSYPSQTDMTTGMSANFVTSSTPWGAGTTSSTASDIMYVQPFVTQLQTTGSAAAGDITSITITASWTES